jgi:hypothetical protein
MSCEPRKQKRRRAISFRANTADAVVLVLGVVEIAQLVVECGHRRMAVPEAKGSPCSEHLSENKMLSEIQPKLFPFGKLLALSGVV